MNRLLSIRGLRASALAASLSLSAGPAQAQLVAYWDFDSATGSTVTDVSGNNLTGTMGGGAALSADAGGFTGEAGDRSLDLGGDNNAQDMMTVTPEQFTPFNPGAGDFSVSFWVKTDVFGGMADHAGTNGYDIAVGAGGVASLVIGSGGAGGVGFEVPATTALAFSNTGVWEHFALVVDRANAEFTAYINGVAETSYIFGWNPGGVWSPNTIPVTIQDISLDASPDGLRIGNKNGNTGFQGCIDDYAIYSVALTADQVAGLADGSRSPDDLEGNLPDFEITDVQLLSGDRVELTWNSRPGKSYTVFYSTDLADFGADARDDVPSGGATTTVVIDSSLAPIDTEPALFFRIFENN